MLSFLTRLLGLLPICLLIAALPLEGAGTSGLPHLAAADPTDPYIVAQAQALGNDSTRIFAFVRDQIGFEMYRGSVRGARGTLWSKAGNSLDKSSLLIALLGAAGVQAQYVQGQLNSAQYEPLFLTMFPLRSRVVGCIPPGFGYTSAGYYGGYYGDMTDHFWVEFGGGNTPADATIPGSAIGQTFGTVVTRFTTIPQNLRQQITVRVKAETFSLAAGIFGFGPSSNTVLEQTFDTAELAGKPISLFHAASSSAPPALGIGAVTNTYTPILLVGQGDADMTTNPTIKGTDYQELLTNFPLGSTILTGVFLEIDALDAGGTKQTYTRTVFDRIGFNVRQNGGSVNISSPAATNPVFSDADVITIYALPGLQSPNAFSVHQTRFATVQQQLAAIQPQIDPLQDLTSLTPSQTSLLQRGLILSRYNTIARNELMVLSFARAEDVAMAQLQQMYMTRALFNSPRLLLGVTSYQNGVFSSSLDILKKDTRDFVETGNSLGQSTPRRPGAAYQFEIARGMMESTLEGQVLSQITGQPAITIDRVFAALPDPSKFLFVVQQNVEALELTTLSAIAKARITLAAGAGKLIITPYQMVTINGTTTVAWYEHDPATGATISVFEDGGHQALVEYVYADFFGAQVKKTAVKMIGFINGYSIAGIAFMAGVLQSVADNSDFNSAIDNTGKTLKELINRTFANALKNFTTTKTNLDNTLLALGLKANWPKAIGPGFDLLSLVSGLADGIDAAAKLFQRNLKADPPVFTFLSSDLTPEQPRIVPGASAGVKATIVTDTLFTEPYHLVQLPSVYIARVQNLGPNTDTFKIAYSGVPLGYTIQTSATTLPVGPGQTGETGVCLLPTGDIPPPNTPVAFSIDVSSVKDPTIKSSVPTTFIVPTVQAAVVKADPPTSQITPGSSVPVNVVIQSVGNAAVGNVDLSIALPPGLTASSLTSPVAPAVGQTLVQKITFTVSPAVTPGSTLNAAITASYGPSTARQTDTVEVIVRATSTFAKCSQDASDMAIRLGRARLGAALDSLGLSINDLAAAPGDTALKARVLGYLDNLNVQMDSAFLTPYVAQFTAQKAALTAADAGGVPSALNALSTVLCNLGATLQSANTYNFNLLLSPVSTVSTPTAPAVFSVQLSNFADVTKTYVFGISGLPAGVTAVFNRPKLTLDRYVSDGYTTVTISQSTANLQAFSFTVTATVEDAPSNQRTATGSLTVRNEFVTVDNVTVTPGIVAKAGDNITVNARVFNAVNQAKSVFLTVWIRSVKTGQPVRTGFFDFDADAAVNLDPSTTLVNTLVATIPTTNYSPGAYTAEVYVGTNGDVRYGTYLSLGKANFFVGAPINATLTATPSTVAPGTSVLQGKLTFNRDAVANPVSTLLGAVAIPGTPRTIALNGNDAYVCSDSSITRVDVSNPANPVVKNSFAQAQLTGNGVTGYVAVPCAIKGNNLIVEYSRPNGNTTANVLPTQIAVYDITNPASPTLVSNTGFQKPDANGLSIIGNFGFTTTTVFFYNPFSRFIFAERGDLIAFNLSNLNTPTFAGTLFPAPPGDPDRGGYNQVFSHAVANPTTILLSSTTAGGAGGGDYTAGVGNIIVADVSNPAAMSIVKQVQIPEARLIGSLAIQGNTAIAVGDSQGYYDALSGLTGNLTITSLDVTDPRNPKVLQTIVTGLADNTGPSVVPIGNNTFAAGGTTNSGKPVLLLIDASNPSQLRFLPYDASVLNTPALSSGNLFYALGDTGLSIYRLDTLAGPQIAAAVQIPKSGVTVDQASFSLAPSLITPGATFDTYTWNQPSVNTITWNETITGVVPSVPKQAIAGGTVNYTLPTFGTGQIPLPPVSVLADQIIGMNPFDQTTQALIAVNYPVTLKNPTSISRTYNLSVLGVNPGWVQMPASVTVGALASSVVTLKLTPDATVPAFTNYQFSVAATEASGINGSVFGTLRINQGVDLGSDQQVRTFGLVLTATPAQQSVGLGGSVKYNLHIVNTGNQPMDIVLDGYSALPSPGFYVSFSPNYLTVPPGIGNGQDRVMTVTTDTNATPGLQNFTVRASFFGTPFTTSAAINILAGGVTTQLTPSTGTPSTPYQLTVRNWGKSQDTFDLSLSGALGASATLASSSVTLAAGAQQTIPVTLGAIDFALPGNLTLTATATSHANAQVTSSTKATVTVAGIKGVTAVFNPGQAQVATAPGSTTVGLNAINTGNTSDSYTASITSTTGPVTASLSGTDGNPTQTIPVFRLAGLSSGRIPVTVGLASAGSGSVTVTVASVSDPTVKASATVTIGAGGSLQPPVANAGSSQSTSIGKAVALDGSASVDVNSPPLALTYLWTLLSKPSASTLSNSSIQNAPAAKAAVTPDAAGTYTFQIAVTNSVGTSTATAAVTVGTVTPTAGVSASPVVQIGGTIALDGTTSTDGNSPPLPLTYQWTLVSSPAGSILGGAAIRSATSAKAFFVPDVLGVFTFKLTVSNGTQSASANVSTNVIASPPVAIARAHQNVAVGSMVFLDGGKSFDWLGARLTYLWDFVSQPAGSALTGADIGNRGTPRPFFTPKTTGPYVIRLAVNNGTADSAPSSVTITAFNSGSVPPTANAGVKQNVARGSAVTLDATRSTGAGALTYLWRFSQTPPGSSLAGGAPASAASTKPTFVPDVAGDFILTVRVTNASGSDEDSVTISAFDGNVPPNANAGSDLMLAIGIPANLDGSASNDPDRAPQPLTYSWKFQSAASGLADSAIAQSATSTPSFTPDKAGYYVVRLQAFDGADRSFDNAAVFAAGSACDADGNGVIQQQDIDLISAAIGLIVGAGDPRDADADGKVTDNDVKLCTARISVSVLPSIGAQPERLVFDYQKEFGPPKPQKVVVTASLPLGYRLVTTPSWLTATPSFGSAIPGTNGIINVSVDALGSMPAGLYDGLIVVVTPGAQSNPVVRVRVNLTDPPQLIALPGELSFRYVKGSLSPQSQVLYVTASGRAIQFDAVVTNGNGWLTVNPNHTQIPMNLSVAISPGGLPVGDYEGTIALSSPDAQNSPKLVTVKMKVVSP